MLPVTPELEVILKELDSSDLMNQISNYNEDLQQCILTYLKTFGIIEKKALNSKKTFRNFLSHS